MSDTDKPVLVYSTFPTVIAAEAAGIRLVEVGLAACVNVIPGMTSIYRWEGKLERCSEAVMIVKTRESLADLAIAEARRHHPYTNPAFLTVGVEGGSQAYIEWLMAETQAQTR